MGSRSGIIRRIPSVATIDSRTSTETTSFAIVQLLDQALEVPDVGLRQLSMLAEVLDQGGDPATEHATEQPFALGSNPLLAREHCRVHVAPPFLPGTNRPFAHQPGEQCLDGRDFPILPGERCDHRLARGGPLTPE